ncbi:hypothetical protein FHS07_000147 [Microbacterium proteolyticum]|uniref:DUF4239 domain-containing protein n=1 Tax=Microbacterium proteolyticum TaxID=1572644 RepID=A0A7W5CF22_9MICO|nr:DUF4239 domain-containing protein [Microbacterium proteolyticum]MBB3156463.1 hypothetical protein [Microbacterium proteolyticum]
MPSFFDLPVWVGLPLFVLAVVGVSSLLVLLLRGWVRRASAGRGEWDRILSYAVGAYGIIYGVTLGLIAAGAYGNFALVNSVVVQESSAVAVLYRDAGFMSEPAASDLKGALIAYTNAVITEDWPLQEQRIAPEATDEYVTGIQRAIAEFQPANDSDVVAKSQAIGAFNTFVTDRRERISLTHLSLPWMLWIVIGVGALLNAVLLALIEVKDLRIHLLMSGLISTFLAILVYSIAGFDHVYSGPIAVTPEHFRDLLTGLFAQAP